MRKDRRHFDHSDPNAWPLQIHDNLRPKAWSMAILAQPQENRTANAFYFHWTQSFGGRADGCSTSF
jgi:hypothetical protein